MKVLDCMTRDVQLARPDMTLQEAARLMGRCDSGVLPVEENDRLVGMLTDRDIAIRAIAEGKGPEARVGDCMTTDVQWCFEDDDVEEALELMGEEQIRRMPVLSQAKRLVGIVSIGDLTDAARPDETGRTLEQISRQGGQHCQSLH
jgi:CBS domain-containing protein